MSSTQQIIVKVFYNDLNENEPEIRRFDFDTSLKIGIYQRLETKISQLNTDYVQGQFSLQYEDEDKDRITFSSDNEFQSALDNNFINGIIKIFVKPSSKQNQTVHAGVTCDGCQGSIIGNRYKCMECSNYDLCQTCSNKNIHSQHNMLKLTRPFQHHRHGCRGHVSPRLIRQRLHHSPWDINNILNKFKGKDLSHLIEFQIPEQLRNEKLNEVLNQLKTGEQADKPVDETILLENVGKTLREILSSLGVKCDFSVDTQNDQTNSNEKKEEATTTTATTATTTTTATAAATTTATPTTTQTTTASNNTSAEPKPTALPLNNLIEQFQTIFSPIFQQSSSTRNEDEKKINECVEQMKSMGFVDLNSALTELIKSKKGDLEQVLDALNPRNH